MRKTGISFLIGFLILWTGGRAMAAQSLAGLYQIISGDYSECCGLGGPSISSLPSAAQTYVKIAVDQQTQLPSMSFLSNDMHTVFSIQPCPAGYPIQFSFGYGLVLSNEVVFHVDPGPAPYFEYWNFTVSNTPPGLHVDGLLGYDSRQCGDIPTRFSYSNVVAVLVSSATIRVSEVEICWNAASNIAYQVQYQSALGTNDWINLGAIVLGNGGTNCVTDKVPQGPAQRVYRVVPVP